MLDAKPRYQPFTNVPDDPNVTHILHVNVTRNNIHLTFVDSKGKVGPCITGGTGKTFKGQGRSTYEAAHQATLKMMTRVLEYGAKIPEAKLVVRLSMRGILGAGREAVLQCILGPTGDEFRPLIGRVEDRTRLKMGGDRARKPRRV